jgi:hypothetical protein
MRTSYIDGDVGSSPGRGNPPLHRAALAFLALLAVSACSTTYGPESPYYRYPGGTRLVLSQPLHIPAGAATVRLQFGQVVAMNAVQEMEPHCILEVNDVSDGSEAVMPDSFEITSVRRSISTFAGLPVMPPVMPVGYGRDDRPSQIYYKTRFALHSTRQPGVRSLTCQSNQLSAGNPNMRYLTLAEIRQALGGIFSLLIGT